MKVANVIYQLKLGKPFTIRDIDPLFYACDFISSELSFFMEKEKFKNMLKTGFIRAYQEVSSF